jgi:hypothetical protein
MESEEGGRLQYDCRPAQPGGTNEERGQTGDNAIHRFQVWRAFPAPIQDDELVLNENRFGNDGPGATRGHQPRNRGNQMDEQNGEITH